MLPAAQGAHSDAHGISPPGGPVAGQTIRQPAGSQGSATRAAQRRMEALGPSIMADSPTDKSHLQELLEHAAEGDEQAWFDIVDLYARRVFGLLRSAGANDDLAEEITQATFCKMAEKIGSYTESGRFEAWLFRIAVNRLKDEIRRQKRQATSVEHDTLSGLAGTGPQQPVERAGTVYGSPELHALRQALSELSEMDRILIQLRHYCELGFQQIAEILGEPTGTVLARHHRAKRKLADKLAHLNPTNEENG